MCLISSVIDVHQQFQYCQRGNAGDRDRNLSSTFDTRSFMLTQCCRHFWRHRIASASHRRSSSLRLGFLKNQLYWSVQFECWSIERTERKILFRLWLSTLQQWWNREISLRSEMSPLLQSQICQSTSLSTLCVYVQFYQLDYSEFLILSRQKSETSSSCVCNKELEEKHYSKFWDAVEFSEQQLHLMQETNCKFTSKFSQNPIKLIFLIFIQIGMFVKCV